MRENARGNSENRASPVSLSFALSLFLPLSLSPFPSPLPFSLYLALSRVIPASAEQRQAEESGSTVSATGGSIADGVNARAFAVITRVTCIFSTSRFRRLCIPARKRNFLPIQCAGRNDSTRASILSHAPPSTSSPSLSLSLFLTWTFTHTRSLLCNR